MTASKISKALATIFDLGVRLAEAENADAILLMPEEALDWDDLKSRAGSAKLLVVVEDESHLEGLKPDTLATIVLKMVDAPVFDKLTQALLHGVEHDLLTHRAHVVAVYSGFDPDRIDTISFIRLEEHLGKLTARDLRGLAVKVELNTLKAVVDLAVEIGREGREGKPVGTMFVIGDTRKVMAQSHPAGFDPVKGYGRKERSVFDGRCREALKEIAQLDGAFVVTADGIVEAACRLIDTAPVNLTLSKGLGSRHWAAAAISRNTNAIAVVVSESNGTVRLFQNGEVVLRVEPFRQAMKWKDFEFEPPPSEGS